MNQHEIMDNMTHEEFETINNENSSNEEKAKAWNDASKRIENYGVQRTSYIHEDLQELIKLLHVISDNLLCIQDNLCASNIMHDYKQSFDDILFCIQDNLIASTGKIIDKGCILDISNSSSTDGFINDWMNAVSNNFVIPEDLIKEYEEKQAANEDNNKVIEANDIIEQLKEQNEILKSIDNHLDKLVRKPIK